MDRRDFLRKSAMLGGAAMLGPRMPWALGSHQGPTGSILADPVDEHIDTIVVLMMENRSVDHYLGWMATDEHFLDRGVTFNGDQTQSFLDPGGVLRSTYHLPSKSGEESPYRGCHHPDPGHGWSSGRAQMANGFLGAGSQNDEFAIGYYQPEDIPLYATLARRFTTFDAYHCSTLTSTYPNREYMHSAQSGGITNNVLPPEVGSGADRPYLHGFTWDTIWDRLQAGGMIPGKDAAYFFVDLPAIALWGERMIPFAQHIEDYFARAASGTLPRVVFLDPGFTTGLRTDDHPYADIRAGQKLVTDLVKAFVDSPHWGRGAFFITYDEWGGFFDHVAPPTLPDNLAGQWPDGLNPPGFEQAGFRVPTIMVSPHCQKGTVDHHLYDHTSILRFIEWRYLGAPAEATTSYTDPESLPSWALTLRDANALNIGASLVAGSDPDFETPLLPEVPVTSLPCEGEELEGTGAPISGVPVSSSALPDLSESHAFEHALNQGFFEQMGFTIDLRKKVPSL